ncbi:hypothetical protein HDV05_008439 [Chytridiales sp. JEL 0842]|nr:hypothetical protein HDV05_008439 [Chytridiales sp. JEL 0842]
MDSITASTPTPNTAHTAAYTINPSLIGQNGHVDYTKGSKNLKLYTGLSIPPEHLQLWPYSYDQLIATPLLIERFKVWRGIVNIYKTNIDTITNSVLADRSHTVQAIAFHEKAKARRIPSSRSNELVDPWLTERVLYKQLSSMIAAENGYQAHVTRVVNDMAKFDAHVIDEIRRVFGEYVQARNQQFDSMKSHLASAISAISPLESTQPFEIFARSTNFHKTSPTWTSERSLSSFPYSISEIKILKQSVLKRPGIFASWPGVSRWSWTPALFVLTESGYLHCFKEAHGSRAAEERRAEQRSKRWGQKEAAAAEVPPSPEVLAAEAAEMPAYEKLKKPKTFYSICLSKPGRIHVQILNSRPHEHIFTVMIQTKPNAAGINELQEDKKLKGWKRYEIKASDEEEMVEWVGILRAKIESYMPAGPPAPLFSPTHEIQERVETAALLEKSKIANTEPTSLVGPSVMTVAPMQSEKTLITSNSGAWDNAAATSPLTRSTTVAKGQRNVSGSSAVSKDTPEKFLQRSKTVSSSPSSWSLSTTSNSPSRPPPAVPSTPMGSTIKRVPSSRVALMASAL